MPEGSYVLKHRPTMELIPKSPPLGSATTDTNDLTSLCGEVLKNTGVQDTLQITDDTNARFAIEQALLRHPTDAVFSSHGRPYFNKHGIVRWQMLDSSGDTPEWWVAHDNRLVKYDEYLDEYEEVGQVPVDDTIEEVPPGGYGTEISEEEDRGSNRRFWFRTCNRFGTHLWNV